MQPPSDLPRVETVCSFQRLPENVIEIILYHVDPNAFASLAILNRTWRNISNSAALYKHHLAQCHAWPEDNDGTNGTTEEESLARLRKAFAQQVRQNLFSAYLSPKKRLVKLIAPSTSSSLAFPFGEVFKIGFSPKGRWLLAISSSRIFIVHLPGHVPVPWRELEVSRRPVAVELSESGNFLAVLSPNQRVTTYRLDNHGVHCIQSIMLESTSAAIALSSDCSVLAAAHEQYIEIISLSQGHDQLPISKRTVVCNQVDHLAFHLDDAFLLGTSTKRRKPTTIVIHKPRSQVNDEGSPVEADPGRLWTTEVLFPNTFQSCSHAIALASKRRLSPRVFAFDVPADVFGVLDLEEMEYGPVTFALPRDRGSSLHLSTVMPAATNDGVQVAFPSPKTGLWLYSDPNRLNVDITKTPQDDDRHAIVQGYKLPTKEKFTGLQWVSQASDNSLHQQLIGVLPGAALEHDPDMDQIKEPQDSAHVMLLDFDYYVKNDMELELEDIILELNVGEIEKLEDDHVQLDNLMPSPRLELSASASRQIRRQNVPLGRSITSAGRGSRRRRDQASLGLAGSRNTIANPPLPPIMSIPRSATTASSGSRGRGDEAEAAYDDPYSHQQPRSRTTLQRAATAAAVTRRQHLQSLPTQPLQFRRADGRGELPHESDADNWVPPPPPYAPKSDLLLPHFLRASSMTLESSSSRRLSDGAVPLIRSHSYHDDMEQVALSRTNSTLRRDGNLLRVERPALARELSDSSIQQEPTPSPGGIEAADIDPLSDEPERPMSANLTDGWYSEPFPVWTGEVAEEHASLDATLAANTANVSNRPGLVTIPSTASNTAPEAQESANVLPQLEPDHFYQQTNAASLGSPISPDYSIPRPHDLATDYYGPQSQQSYPYPYQDQPTTFQNKAYPIPKKTLSGQSRWKKMFKCQIM